MYGSDQVGVCAVVDIRRVVPAAAGGVLRAGAALHGAGGLLRALLARPAAARAVAARVRAAAAQGGEVPPCVTLILLRLLPSQGCARVPYV